MEIVWIIFSNAIAVFVPVQGDPVATLRFAFQVEPLFLHVRNYSVHFFRNFWRATINIRVNYSDF